MKNSDRAGPDLSVEMPDWERVELVQGAESNSTQASDDTAMRDDSEKQEHSQLILHPTARSDLATRPSSTTRSFDNSPVHQNTAVHEYTWQSKPLRSSPSRLPVRDGDKAPTSPKPVLRDLRRSCNQPARTGLMFGVGERENER